MAPFHSLRNITFGLTACVSLALAGQESGVPAAPHVDFGVVDSATWVTEGRVVPDLELPLVDGSGVFDLASLRGKKVLLVQFASW